MKLPENILSAARYCQMTEHAERCEAKINEMLENKQKNVAIMGEANCGKTTVLNQICGFEVKRPSPIVSEAIPVMVASSTGKMIPDYEYYHIDHTKLAAENVSLFEIPAGEIGSKAVEMDLILYVISATMPFSATDISNLEKMPYLPVAIVVNKLDLIESEEDKKETMEYISYIVSRKFNRQVIGILTGTDEPLDDAVISCLGKIDIADSREFRAQYMVYHFKEELLLKLKDGLAAAEDKLKAIKSEQKLAQDSAEQVRLEWESLRIEMMEKQQETQDKMDLLINKSKQELTAAVFQDFEKSGDKGKWLEKNLESYLSNRLAALKKTSIDCFKAQFELHIAWLVSEANDRIGCDIDPNTFRCEALQNSQPDNVNIGASRNRVGTVFATGAAAIAVAAIISPLSLLPTCLISVPAALVSAYFVNQEIRQEKNQTEKTREMIIQYINNNYQDFTDRMHTALKNSYENIIRYIASLADVQLPADIHDDQIIAQRSEILRLMDTLTTEA